MEKKESDNLNESNFDEFAGFKGSLFNNVNYDDDDDQADQVWNEIDARMDERRKSRREQRVVEQLNKFRSVRPKLQHQFTDLKRDLSHVSQEEWDALPEPGEHRKHSAAEKRNERFTPAPDSLLDKARQESEVRLRAPHFLPRSYPAPLGPPHSRHRAPFVFHGHHSPHRLSPSAQASNLNRSSIPSIKSRWTMEAWKPR